MRNLQKAKMMFEFAISGWSEDKGGGIYWNAERETIKTLAPMALQQS
ncbi:hypothetical protein [Bacillus sp. SA1-12]|nr:hypothetical protein [Bacillus sp. SA1-12]